MAQQGLPADLVFVGSYTRREENPHGKSDGIDVYRLDSSNGALTHLHTQPDVVNPSFLALHPSRRYLYAVDEVEDPTGRPVGGVSAFAIDQTTGALTFLNRQSSGGTAPCHLVVERTGRYVLAVNYSSGSVVMLPIREGGALGEASDFVQHHGSSVDPARQQGPHAHSVNVDAGNRYALVADLGLDKVLVYRLDLERGKLVPNDPPSVSVRPGSGPRHAAFHPSGRFVYVINELGSTLTAFAYDGARGTLAELQTVSTLPEGFSGRSHCADVRVHPSGTFVYGSNRGHDSIAIFAIDQERGTVTPVGYESTQGRTPRNFNIDPTGTLLLAANQGTDTIVPFRVDQATGRLSPTGHVTASPTPVCIQFVV